MRERITGYTHCLLGTEIRPTLNWSVVPQRRHRWLPVYNDVSIVLNDRVRAAMPVGVCVEKHFTTWPYNTKFPSLCMTALATARPLVPVLKKCLPVD